MPNLAQLIASKSSPEHQRVFDLCREIAGELDGVEGVYVVGGVVRDLILDRTAGDIDLSVVGDARGFAESLATRLECEQPAESQFLTFKINAENLRVDVPMIDVVTARSETYTESAALPEISPSGIDDDLKRRDFSVNAMAVSLADTDLGNLVDPSNGFGDVMRKRIKVLHDASFVDDPTRIFRAVRYATRLGFSLEKNTDRLIVESLENIDRLSGTRVRNEFELMLGEPTRVEILRKSEEIGLLGAISPGLRVGSSGLQTIESQTEEGVLSNDVGELLALVTFGMNEDEASQVVARFDGPADWGESITGNAGLAKTVVLLDGDDLKPSEIVDILQRIPVPSIKAYIAAGPPLPRRGRLIEFLENLQYVKPEINGEDLLAIGIPEGPVMGQLIDLVRRAKLDGQVSSKQEELDLAKSRLPGFLTR
jgi:tRNA nucleotidyltransferase (CCA-adding enzyme)